MPGSRGGACRSQCQVKDDVTTGWEGFCLGLQMVNASTVAELCQKRCCADPNCEVWQWGNKRDIASKASLGICYNGKGLECSSDRLDDFLVLAGQRITHGTVQKTDELSSGSWCTGIGMRQASFTVVGTNTEEVKNDCRDICYADSTCSAWQLSTQIGCWYGVDDNCNFDERRVLDMVAGEQVARACGDDALRQTHTNYLKVFGIISLVAFVLTCCAMTILLFHARFYGPTTKRSLHDEDDDDEEEDKTGRSSPWVSHRTIDSYDTSTGGTTDRSFNTSRNGIVEKELSAGSFQSWTPYQSGVDGGGQPPASFQPSFSSAGSSFPQQHQAGHMHQAGLGMNQYMQLQQQA